jgi:uncharacterized membrane protein
MNFSMPDQDQHQQPHQSVPPASAPTPAHNQKAMAVLCYLGILIVIPFLTAKDDPFVKFHMKQGLLLLIAWIIVSVVGGSMMWTLWPVLQLINLAIAVLAIIGIVNVVHQKQVELPIVGSLAKHFTF